MNRFRMIVGLSCALLSGTAITTAALEAQVAQGTAAISVSNDPGFFNSAYDFYNKNTAEVTDILTKDYVGEGINSYANALHNQAGKTVDSAAKTYALSFNKKLSPELVKEGRVASKQGLADAKGLVNDSNFVKNVGKALDAINFVSVGAQGLGYLAEGDFKGAVGVVFQEGTKKIITGGGAAALSWIPGVGPFLGSFAGDQFFSRVVKGEMEAYENGRRDSDYAQKYLNKPWLTPVLLMDENGKVTELEPDMYLDKNTGLVKRRTPEAQKAFEEGQRVKWKDGLEWGKIVTDLAEGKISEQRYDQLLADYRNRDPLQPWDPSKVPINDVARFAGSYSGRFSGGAQGSVSFTVNGNAVNGTVSGACIVKPCSGDAITAGFSGSVSDQGIMTTSLSGHFVQGKLGFAGSFNGVLQEGGGSGTWSGGNKYGTPTGNWSAGRQ